MSAALSQLERDQDYSRRWSATREDIQNAGKIIGEGEGWVDRLEFALKAGAILPALGFAILGDRSAPVHDLDRRAAEMVIQIPLLFLGIGRLVPDAAVFRHSSHHAGLSTIDTP